MDRLTTEGSAAFEDVTRYAAGQPPNVFRQAAVNFIFADLWTSSGLTRRQRRFCALSASAQCGTPIGTEAHVYGALRSGDISVGEMGEFLLHFAFYAGSPLAAVVDITLARVLAKISQEDGHQLTQSKFDDLALDPDAADSVADETALAVLGASGAALVRERLEPAMWRFEFGRLWTRGGLSRADRRIVTITSLACQGSRELVELHVAAAIRSGELDADGLTALASMTSTYGGIAAGHIVAGSVPKMPID